MTKENTALTLETGKVDGSKPGLIRLYMHSTNTRELLLCYGEPTKQEAERDPAFELIYNGDSKEEAYSTFVGMATMIESTHS